MDSEEYFNEKILIEYLDIKTHSKENKTIWTKILMMHEVIRQKMENVSCQKMYPFR